MEEQQGQGAAYRQQRALSELLRLTKENNRILREGRNMRRLKMVIVVLFLLGSSGYGYHLFNKYQAELSNTLAQIDELRDQIGEVVELGGQIKETAQSITGILGGGAGDSDGE